MSGIQMMMLGGTPPILDTQTVTSAVSGTLTGFSSGSFGSISDGTSNIYGGAAILALNYDSSNFKTAFTVTGGQPNSGWNILTISSTSGTVQLYRDEATYISVGNTAWTWTGAASKFGTAGTVVTCVFT